MRRLSVLICLFTLACVSSAALGDEPPLITDRPDQVDSPFIVPRGLFQIEGGATHGERDMAGEQVTLQAFPTALLRLGLTESFELRLGVPGIQIQQTDSGTGETREDGLVDATLGAKFKIVGQSGAVPQTAFVGTLIVPSGSDEFTSDRVDPGFRFAFGNSLSETVALTYNLGMFWLSQRNSADQLDTRSFFDWAITASVSATSKLGLFGELFGVTGISAETRPVNSTGAGVTYLLTPRLQVDGRVTVGLSRTALDWTAGLGVSYRFPSFKG